MIASVPRDFDEFVELIYLFILIVYHYTKPNYRRREEHGSAKWGNKSEIDKRYRQTPPENNKILSQNLAIGYDAHKHRRNLNTLVVGGSGAGKTRFYCKPNLMQCNTSFVILDPKGEILRDTGYLLREKGYITNVDCGHGLVKIGGALVPFVNRVPKDTRLYELMTTKPGE